MEERKDLEKLVRLVTNNVREEEFDLLRRMLVYNPERRLTASQALDDPWFSQEPLAQKNSLASLVDKYPRRQPMKTNNP